ncbi:response regulator transcription factor [Streptococcus jiangjianxini]|uniref:response regulator transcription factor n=1 Tax=Streptococcus jiangjianxini TaxID=3161189 RepID=UPI0032EE959F
MKILLAEDELQMSRVLSVALSREGYDLDVVHDGQAAVEMAAQNAYDVMVLDIMMPIKTGIDALKEIRATGDESHVIMLTAMAEVDDRVTGLDSGADDYLTKPFSLKELLARLRSMERRLENMSPNIIEVGSVRLNLGEQELSAGNSIRLSGKEAKMMAYFMRHQGKGLAATDVFTHVWTKEEQDEVDPSYVFVYVSYLRQKLQAIKADVTISDAEDGQFVLERVEGDCDV